LRFDHIAEWAGRIIDLVGAAVIVVGILAFIGNPDRTQANR
jgi:hypothetical protein